MRLTKFKKNNRRREMFLPEMKCICKQGHENRLLVKCITVDRRNPKPKLVFSLNCEKCRCFSHCWDKPVKPVGDLFVEIKELNWTNDNTISR